MDEIRNLSELLRVFENRASRRIMYFRGQVRDWCLKPSLARESVSQQEREKESDCFERLAKILTNVNDWERATIAQHHGVPTRLLDWSENPLVGIYFAIEGNEYDGEDGVIWVFEDKTAVAGDVASFQEGSGPRRLHYPRPYRAWKDLQNRIPRVIAQRGAVTSQPDLSKKFDEQKFDRDTQSLRKFIVPRDTKRELRNHLTILGVTEQRLFPDFLDIGNNRPTDIVGLCVRIRCELFRAG
jgi:hypothetical protein